MVGGVRGPARLVVQRVALNRNRGRAGSSAGWPSTPRPQAAPRPSTRPRSARGTGRRLRGRDGVRVEAGFVVADRRAGAAAGDGFAQPVGEGGVRERSLALLRSGGLARYRGEPDDVSEVGTGCSMAPQLGQSSPARSRAAPVSRRVLQGTHM
jgi:hypothetical protein